jgi:hypothetical protein
MKYLTYFENILWDGINFSDYEIKNDLLEMDKQDEINLVYDTFEDEFWHDYNKKRYKNHVKGFANYLMGLPSFLSFPFSNYEILDNAKKSKEFDLSTEEKEDKFLEDYFENLSLAFFSLYDNL